MSYNLCWFLTPLNPGKERSEFLSWVSDIDFEEVHRDIYAKKHTGTADWLIQDPKFQQWMRSARSSLLWCNGKREWQHIIH